MADLPQNLTIKQLDLADRPREKLIQNGPEKISNAELFAILIGTGNQGESAVQLMQRVLFHHDNQILKLKKVSLQKLMEFKGIGMVKAVKIKAALELSKRLNDPINRHKIQLVSSKITFDYIAPQLAFLDHEEFWVIYLNRSNRLIDSVCLSKGGIYQTLVDIRLALKRAIELGATGMILVHNHPSGNLNPSKEDKQITTQFIKASATFDILILDHLIVSEKSYFSFKDESLI